MPAAAWFLYYGLRIGLTYDQAMEMDISLLMDLIACHQIKVEGFEQKDNSDDLMSILAMR